VQNKLSISYTFFLQIFSCKSQVLSYSLKTDEDLKETPKRTNPMKFKAPIFFASYQAQCSQAVASAALALNLLLPPRANLSISYSS